MPTLGMNGPYLLDAVTIDQQVTQTKAGNYALGYKNTSNENFVVEYVGRSDYDVNERLKDHIGEGYKLFKFCYATSPMDAFKKECENYHDFTPKDNTNHPDRPDGADWKCPRCDIFE